MHFNVSPRGSIGGKQAFVFFTDYSVMGTPINGFRYAWVALLNSALDSKVFHGQGLEEKGI